MQAHTFEEGVEQVDGVSESPREDAGEVRPTSRRVH